MRKVAGACQSRRRVPTIEFAHAPTLAEIERFAPSQHAQSD
jgi:hypothetical protein